MQKALTYISLKSLAAIALACLPLVPEAKAQDAAGIVEELQAGTLPIKETATPVLLPFAIEWDAKATAVTDAGKPATADQYRALAVPDGGRLAASLKALANNDDALTFYTDPKTIDAFNRTYQKAVDDGSSIGMIPQADAMRYWMISRTVTAGPEAIAAYRAGRASPEWCLPPLIRCTPPRPAPKE